MNTAQYQTYFDKAYNQMRNALIGRSYREIGLLGNSAATMASNLMQKDENELAYKRSTAAHQVSLMRGAGMSRAGAINALNGGGSYTPAPINVASTGTDAQNLRSQDMNNLFSALESFSANTAQMAQLQEQKRQFNMQLAAQKEQNAANRENAKDIATIQAEASRYGADTSAGASKYGADSAAATARDRLKFDKEQFDKLSPYQIRQIEANIDKLKADKTLTDKQADDLAYRMAEYQSQEYKSVRDAKNLIEGLQADFDYRITEKSFADYLNENYDYVNGEYVPKKWISNANKVQNGARAVWNTIFEIVPLNLLLESLGGTVENVRALKMLSKLK